jgi:hypothetical protein
LPSLERASESSIDVSRSHDARPVVAIVSGELAAELAAPAAFFERLTASLAAGRAPGAEDLDVAREEVARLRGLSAGLARAAGAVRTRVDSVNVQMQLHNSGARLAPQAANRGVRVMIDVRAELAAAADAEVFAEACDRLLEHAVRVTEPGTALVVTARADDGVLRIEWRGHGEEKALARPRPFAWEALGEGASLGLTVARARAHACGFRVTSATEDGAFTVTLAVPQRA